MQLPGCIAQVTAAFETLVKPWLITLVTAVFETMDKGLHRIGGKTTKHHISTFLGYGQKRI